MNIVGGMTKANLIKDLAARLLIPRSACKALLNSLAETAVREVQQNGIFVIPGIGRLVAVQRRLRLGRSPGPAEIRIRTRTVLKFRVAKAVSDAVALAPAESSDSNVN